MRKEEAGTSGGLGVHPYFATHKAYQVAGNGQTNSGAAIKFFTFVLTLIKALENALRVFIRQANPGVFYVKDQLLVAFNAIAEFHRALFGKFYGVAHYVVQDLSQTQRIG